MRSIAMPFKALAIASMLTVTSQGAMAEEITLTHGPITGKYTLGGENIVRLNLASQFVAVLNAGSIQIDHLAPASSDITRTTRNKFISVSFDMPVTKLTGDFTQPGSDSFSPTKIETSGGLSFQSADDEIISTGGGMVIANLRIDSPSHRIYGDLTGDNGVGLRQQLHLWNFDNVSTSATETPFNCFLTYPIGKACQVSVNPELTFSNLTITSEAFDLFTQSMGLLPDGVSGLSKITDYGTLVATVPETSTVVQLGVGLAGLGLIGARSRRRQPTAHSQ